MLNLDPTKRTQMTIRPLTAGTYVVLGLAAFTSVWYKGTDSEKAVTVYNPVVGKLNEAKNAVVSVQICHRSDLCHRINPVVGTDKNEYDNSGDFIDFVDEIVKKTPVGVHPDIYYALKVLPEIRSKAFEVKPIQVSCISERTKNRYRATVYESKIVNINVNALTSSDTKRKAIQKLANGFEIEGLNGTVEFGVNGAAIIIDETNFVPVLEA